MHADRVSTDVQFRELTTRHTYDKVFAVWKSAATGKKYFERNFEAELRSVRYRSGSQSGRLRVRFTAAHELVILYDVPGRAELSLL